MKKLKIEYIKKEDLKPYVNNAKIHTSEQIEQIKKSIEEFGMNDPIAVWKDNEIIEGHGRLLAVMEMEDIKEVPVINLDSLSDEQRKAYNLIHNKITMNTGFDFLLIEEELKKITSIDMNLFGFESLNQITESLDEFFKQEPEKEIKQEEKTVKIDNIIFTIKPKDKKDMLIEFLNNGDYIYEEK